MSPKVQFAKQAELGQTRLKFREILQRMFPDCQQVIAERAFTADSYGGGWVFLVKLVSGEPGPRLPVVVKIASASLIDKEWQGYARHIQDKWPNTARMSRAPVSTADGVYSGLCYELVGGGVFPVQGLRAYCLERRTKPRDVELVAERLRKVLVSVLRFAEPAPAVRLGASYDRVLPVNLLIEPSAAPPEIESRVIRSYADTAPPLQPGDWVRVEGFVVTKVDLQADTVTLDLPRPTDGLPEQSYRTRLKYASSQPLSAYTVGQPAPATEGQVIETRDSRWRDEMQKVVADEALDLAAEYVTMPGGISLPNPYRAVEGILERYRALKVGHVHGDLNLGNIMVDRETRDVCLIDFAESRWDHVLHDFWRLETEVVTKLVAPALTGARLSTKDLWPFYEQLHDATFGRRRGDARSPHAALDKPFALLQVIRQAARDYGLFVRDDCAEYYDGLTLYLLGALRFRNLDQMPCAPAPKQAAFWAAAAAQRLCHHSFSQVSPSSSAHLFICYARRVETDRRLAIHLDESLTAHGHDVFIDTSLRGGDLWLEEIDRQIKASDFMIALLSEQSADSEMVKAEIIRAYEHRRLQGRPHILPIRVAYDGLLPYSIAAFLNDRQYLVWQSASDNARVAVEILEAIAGRLPDRPPVQDVPVTKGVSVSEDGRPISDDQGLYAPLPEFDPRLIEELEMPGGAVKLRDRFYVEREADKRLRREIVRPGTITTIRAPRQTGKSSLLMRGVHHARQHGARALSLNVQLVNRDRLPTLETFLRYLAEFIVSRLQLDVSEVERAWRGFLGPQDKLTDLMKDYVLTHSDAPIVLALDEVDRLLETEWYSDFFALLRVWHESRVLDERWNTLNMVMVISTEPYLLIDSTAQSPFNVGLRLYPQDFDEGQMRDLNRRHGSPVTEPDFGQFVELIGGHPYLARKALYTLVSEQITWPELMRVAATDHGPFGDHLRRYHWLLRDEPDLKSALRDVIQGSQRPDDEALFRLKRAGLVKESEHTCRCDLYRRYFEERLV